MTIDLEKLLRDAGRTAPPSGVDVARAADRGRALGRRHRAVWTGAAAIAVVAGLGSAWTALPRADGTAPVPPAEPVAGDPVLVQPGEGTLMQAHLRGVLRRDGPCLTLDNGAFSFVVVWPPGTRWSTGDETVVLPDGLRIAQGERVSGSGGFLSASNRNFGKPALDCAKRTEGQIALINNVTKG